MSNKIIIVSIAAIIIIVGAYFFLVKPMLDDRTVPAVAPVTINREDDLHFSFSFPSGESEGGYSLIERPGVEPVAVATTTEATSTVVTDLTATTSLRYMYLLMDTPTYAMVQADPEAADLPPTISILVLNNNAADQSEGDRMTRLRNWAALNDVLTMFNSAAAEPTMIEIDGVEGLRYESTVGTYPTIFTLLSYRGNVYLFAGQYGSADDSIRTVYEDLVNSVSFY